MHQHARDSRIFNSCSESQLPFSTWSALQSFPARIARLIETNPRKADQFIRWMHWILKSYE